MRRALDIVVLIFGVVCMLIALAHIVLGPSAIPGAVPVNATMDSEDRFYATLFLGFGAALAWCSQRMKRRGTVFGWLLAVFFLGGLARLVSVLSVGLPNDFFQLMAALELALPPLLWWWYRRVYADVVPHV